MHRRRSREQRALGFFCRQRRAPLVKDPNRHSQVFADAYKVPYGIHFRHDNTQRHYSEYGKEMGEVYAGRQNMTDTLKAFTARVNNEVEYGACQPYKGMAVPIKP